MNTIGDIFFFGGGGKRMGYCTTNMEVVLLVTFQ